MASQLPDVCGCPVIRGNLAPRNVTACQPCHIKMNEIKFSATRHRISDNAAVAIGVRLRPTSRFRRLYGLPCSDDFAPGRRGLLQLLSMSLSPCCRFPPAEVNIRIGQSSAAHAAFALRLKARPSGILIFEATTRLPLLRPGDS